MKKIAKNTASARARREKPPSPGRAESLWPESTDLTQEQTATDAAESGESQLLGFMAFVDAAFAAGAQGSAAGEPVAENWLKDPFLLHVSSEPARYENPHAAATLEGAAGLLGLSLVVAGDRDAVDSFIKSLPPRLLKEVAPAEMLTMAGRQPGVLFLTSEAELLAAEAAAAGVIAQQRTEIERSSDLEDASFLSASLRSNHRQELKAALTDEGCSASFTAKAVVTGGDLLLIIGGDLYRTTVPSFDGFLLRVEGLSEQGEAFVLTPKGHTDSFFTSYLTSLIDQKLTLTPQVGRRPGLVFGKVSNHEHDEREAHDSLAMTECLSGSTGLDFTGLIYRGARGVELTMSCGWQELIADQGEQTETLTQAKLMMQMSELKNFRALIASVNSTPGVRLRAFLLYLGEANPELFSSVLASGHGSAITALFGGEG